MAIRVGRWDCGHCGTEEILGPLTHCTQCGASRPEDVLFYLLENTPIVTDKEELKKAKKTPDWQCSHCQSHNKADYQFCGTCGSPFNLEKDKDKLNETKKYSNENVPRSGKIEEASPAPAKTANSGKVKKGFFMTGILGAIFAFFASINVGTKVEVFGYKWERTIEVQQYVEVEKSDWNLPRNAREIKRVQEVHHYKKRSIGFQTKQKEVRYPVGEEQYVCGQEDLGNGFFEDIYCNRTVYDYRTETYQEEVFEKIPVYKTKYKFAVFEWRDDVPIISKGSGHKAYWGTKEGLDNPQKYRIKNKKEAYWTILKDKKGNKHKVKASYSKWKALYTGKELKARKSLFFGYFRGLKEPLH